MVNKKNKKGRKWKVKKRQKQLKDEMKMIWYDITHHTMIMI